MGEESSCKTKLFMKFEQGIWYSFAIIGLTNVSDKGEHFILLHESGRKMLLKTEYYVKYNFYIGQNIQCRVDKVNCTGLIFLEPKHPVYNEGEIYSFRLYEKKLNDSIYNATVKDVFDNSIDVFISKIEEYKSNEKILLKVIQVKKGIPLLLDMQKVQNIALALNKNKYIQLRVNEIKRYNSYNYYIFTDNARPVAKLKVIHYKSYGFKIGDEVQCEVMGSSADGQLVVEPINPWYTVGNVYRFRKIGLENHIDLEGNNVSVLILLDVARNKCGVKISETMMKTIQASDKIECKVIGFRKGRPLLEINP